MKSFNPGSNKNGKELLILKNASYFSRPKGVEFFQIELYSWDLMALVQFL